MTDKRMREETKERTKMDADLPFNFEDLAEKTSDIYAKMISSSDIPIVGRRRYY